MHSIRVQFLAFITALLLVLLLLLNTYPLSASRDAVFEEKRSSLSGQAAVVASSLSGTDRLSQAGVTEIPYFLLRCSGLLARNGRSPGCLPVPQVVQEYLL